MMYDEKNKNGVTFLSLLGLLFIALKLTGHIGWSWWWVLAPLWGPLAVGALFFVVGTVLLFISNQVENED